MSSDNNLQEMEAGTKQSNTAVNAGAGKADPKTTMAMIRFQTTTM